MRRRLIDSSTFVPAPNPLRLLLSGLLSAEGVLGALWVAEQVPSIATVAVAPLLVIVARAVAGALQLTSGWLLIARRLPAVAIARVAVLASVVVTTVGIGGRLTPTDMDPAFRWYAVAIYAAYAGGLLIGLRHLGRRDW